MSNSSFPNKTIWMYWHQGFENTNHIIQECIKSWKYYNPNWEIVLLDEHSVNNYIIINEISKEKWEKLLIQHRSDLIRTKLLIDFGGIWADPTTFCLKPIEEWLPEYLKEGYFFFTNPGQDRVIANWFIAVEKPNNKTLILLYQTLCDYWERNDFRNFLDRDNKTTFLLGRLINRNQKLSQLWLKRFFIKVFPYFPYMIYHYTFLHVLLNNEDLYNQWKRAPKFPADLPHQLKRFGLNTICNDEMGEFINNSNSPLFKLNWNIENYDESLNTVLNFLFKNKIP